MRSKKVAVVGSGCSGLAAVWVLSRSTNHEVHLYESQDRLGGHTNTVKFRHHGKETNVDTGFIVMNSTTYPNFIRFLTEIKIPTEKTEMTFGITRDHGVFEWAGTSISAVFAQRENILNLGMWQMLFDIVRFNQYALDLLAESNESDEDPSGANGISNSQGKYRKKGRQEESIGEYLDRERYSDAFKNDYLVPMTACVWSTSPDKCSLDFPALTLIRFLYNHHLLNTVSPRPPWMTIKQGSQLYIDAIMKTFPQERVHLSTPVKSLHHQPNETISLVFENGSSAFYDHVILATHGDTAASIMSPIATFEETSILSAFKTSQNIAILHSDLSLMPKRRRAWSAWNYIVDSSDYSEIPSTVSLTYWMNCLQHIPESEFGNVLVTLNPLRPPHPKTVQGEWTYHHPLYNADAIRAQKRLPAIQNTRGVSYCGAWTKYGFHEDGFSSGLKVAVEHLGAKLPFPFVDSTFSRGRKPVLGWKDYLVRIFVQLVLIIISIIKMTTGRAGRLMGDKSGEKKLL